MLYLLNTKKQLNQNTVSFMEYNTDRTKLPMPEYGRHIQKMVDHICTIEDRDERNVAAKSLVKYMGNINPHLRDVHEFKPKLWEHLAVMADFDLDIDYPYDRPERKDIDHSIERLPYSDNVPRYGHYGKLLEKMIEKAIAFEEGEKRARLVMLIANHMKRTFLSWNKDVVTDEQIIDDLKKLSKGEIDITGKKLNEVKISKSVNNNNNRKNKYNKNKKKNK